MAKKPPRDRLDVDVRRAQLIEKGIEFFGSRSYDEVSIEELTKELGISKGLLFHYFSTKRAFYAAVIESAAESLLERTDVAADLSPEVRVELGLRAYFTFVEGYRNAFVTLMRGGTDPLVAEVLHRTRLRLVDRILGHVPTEARLPRVRLALRGWIGFVEAVSLDWLEKKPMPRATVVTLCSTAFFAIIGSLGAIE